MRVNCSQQRSTPDLVHAWTELVGPRYSAYAGTRTRRLDMSRASR